MFAWAMRQFLRTRSLTICVNLLIVLFISILGAQNTARKTTEPIEGRTPKEVVDELWRLATQGQLLTARGWQRAGQLCTDPTAFRYPQAIFVVSNEWGPAGEFNVTQDTAEAEVGFTGLGTIDTALHYTPAPKTQFEKEFSIYRLVAVPQYTMMYGPDGKTLLSKRPTETRMWQIKGSQGRPFTTVNTAIRYVLNQRDKTHDPIKKNNADQTLQILKRLEGLQLPLSGWQSGPVSFTSWVSLLFGGSWKIAPPGASV
jgi:hypothetical protein